MPPSNSPILLQTASPSSLASPISSLQLPRRRICRSRRRCCRFRVQVLSVDVAHLVTNTSRKSNVHLRGHNKPPILNVADHITSQPTSPLPSTTSASYLARAIANLDDFESSL
eukprot:m.326800 g.326800  ORF g.326800 m.326800 type:complete len:113 (-) comp16487_c0_seq1:332-670(-)